MVEFHSFYEICQRFPNQPEALAYIDQQTKTGNLILIHSDPLIYQIMNIPKENTNSNTRFTSLGITEKENLETAIHSDNLQSVIL